MAYSTGASCYSAFLRPKSPFPQIGVDFETKLQRRSPSRPIFGQLGQVHGSLAPGSIPGPGRSPGEGTGYPFWYSWSSLVAQTVKNLPVMREIWVQSLGREDPLEEEMAIYSSILAWRTARAEEASGLQLTGSRRV